MDFPAPGPQSRNIVTGISNLHIWIFFLIINGEVSKKTPQRNTRQKERKNGENFFRQLSKNFLKVHFFILKLTQESTSLGLEGGRTHLVDS